MKTPTVWPDKKTRNGATITIYRTSTNGCEEFKVVYYDCEGKRRIKTFSEYERAHDHRESVLAAPSRGDVKSFAMAESDRTACLRAMEFLKPSGVTVEIAASHFAEAFKILGADRIVEAARFFVKKHPATLPDKHVAEVVDEMIDAKESDGLSDCHIEDLRYRLERNFGKDFSCLIASVTGAQVQAWIEKRAKSKKSKKNFRIAINSLFNFAKDRGYLPKDHDEMDSVKTFKTDVGEIGIFTADEISRLLSTANDSLLPFVAVGAFAGLRSSEIERLHWEDFKFDTGFIVVRPEGKTGRRLVPMTDNLRKWLEPLRQKSGLMNPYANATNQLMKLANAAQVEWKHNGLRHSFVSYRVAVTQNVAQVALEAGNSPRIIEKHYRELVTPTEAATWFAIAPGTAENITQLATASPATSPLCVGSA